MLLPTPPQWATGEEIRRAMAAWRILGSPLAVTVARAVAHQWGEQLEHAPNLRAFYLGKEFSLNEALDECLTIASAADDTVTALWEYLEHRR
jgi:hypothetical protein